jgi:hypothetical protein
MASPAQSATLISAVLIGCGAFARLDPLPTLLANRTVRLAAIVDPHTNADVGGIAEQAGAIPAARIEDVPRLAGTVFAWVTMPHGWCAYCGPLRRSDRIPRRPHVGGSSCVETDVHLVIAHLARGENRLLGAERAR